MYFHLYALIYITSIALFIANLTACDSNTTSANHNNTLTLPQKTDTLYLIDTIYIPIKDTVYTPIINTSNSKSNTDSIINLSSSSDSTTIFKSSTSPTNSSITVSSSSTLSNNANLLWCDEFDGFSLDTTKWNYNIGIGDNGWGNNEMEYYTSREENIYVKNGILHIRAQKEDYENSKYTSARILTQNKFFFTYGSIEARIALPVGKGIWPAFWMLGENIDNISWPTCGEIDIIEAINDENIIYGTLHWNHEGNHAEYGNSTADHHGTSTTIDIRDFHNYKMTWDKDFIRMFVDDFKYHEIDIKDSTKDMGTFHKPFFFILNVAVGGTWPGFDIDDLQFPTEMLVDYIRVYKNKE